MIYVLILIIIFSIIYYKYNDISKKYLNYENFNNMSFLNDRGIVIESKINKQYTIGCGEIDTPYHSFSKAINNLNVDALDFKFTQGSIENLNLLEENRIDFAMCQEDIYYNKTLGLNKYTKPMKNIRFVCSLYDELYFLIVPKDSKITSFQSLSTGFSTIDENYIIGTGGEESGSLEILKLLCNLFNIELIKFEVGQTYKNDKPNILYYVTENINTNFNLLLNKKIHALFYISGPRLSYIVNISQLFPLKFIPFPNETYELFNQIKAYKNTNRTIKIQENLIDSNDVKDVKTQGTRCVLLCSSKVSEEYIYHFLKQIFKNLDYLKSYMINQSGNFEDASILGTINLKGSNDWLKKQKYEFIDTYSDSYGTQFKPLEMFYINKNVKYHKGAYKLYREIGYININNNKNCEFKGTDNTCNLVPYLNKKNYYWKYEKLPGLQSEFKR